MDIRSIISKIDEIQESPAVGDVVYLEFGNTLEVETTILEVNGEDIVLEADDRLVGLLEDLNSIEERKIIDEAGIMDKIKGVFGKKPDAAPAPKAASPQAEKRPGNYEKVMNGTKLASLIGHKKSNDIGGRLSKKAASKVVAQFPDGNFYDITLDQGQFRIAPSKQSEEGWYGYAIQKQGNAQVRAPSKNFNAQSLGEDVNEAAPNKAQTLTELEELIEEMEMRLEREVEWAMTDHYDSATVQKLLAPINQSLDNLKRFVVQQQSETELGEAEYQGRNVKLGKPFLTPNGPKKRSVYVKNPKGNVVKVNFGDKKMKIKKSNPTRRKSFRARHNCANPGPRHKARFWSCKFW